MRKPRIRCLVCGDPLYDPDGVLPDRRLTCSSNCYLLYRAWKNQGNLPGHKVRLSVFQRIGDMAQVTKRAKYGVGPYAKATALAQEFIKSNRRLRSPTQAEHDNEVKWRAIREEWAREDAEEAKTRMGKFPRRA